MEEEAQFTCEAFSFSKVKYNWEREDDLLPGKAITDTCSSTLTIPNGTQFDEGNYCCVATNECGPVKECAILSVIGMNDMYAYSMTYTYSNSHSHTINKNCIIYDIISEQAVLNYNISIWLIL